MATCPTCHADIADDFGLITCQNCGAQLMIDFDGSAKIQDAVAPTLEATSDDVSVEGTAGDALAENILFDLQNPTSPIPNVAPMSALSPAPAPAQRSPSSSDMSDIATFGNSEVSQAREGAFRFHILLNGIDTSDVRKHLREVLEDPRFLFNVDELLHSIKDGHMRIADVTAVKASVLIQRLRALPVEITWEQYAIHSG